MRDRLIELLKQADKYASGVCTDYDEAQEVCADYLLAEGVIVPKAKIGDTIYIVRSNRVAEYEIKKIEIHSNGTTYAFNWRGMGYEWVSDTDFCKTVFLTREEAERALKGENDG